MAMSRKNYEAIAREVKLSVDVLRGSDTEVRIGDIPAYVSIKVLAGGLAKVMADDNPRFDRARFLAACGVE